MPPVVQPSPIPPEPPELTKVSELQEPPALPVAEIEEPEPVLIKLFVVVGSKLFWGTVLITVLILIVAAVMNYVNRSPDSSETAVGAATPAALLEARNREIELRAKLNALLQDFNEQRLQCADCDSPAQTPSPIPKAGTTKSVEPAGTEIAGTEKVQSTAAQPSEIKDDTASAVSETVEPVSESQGKLAQSLESALSKTEMTEPNDASSPVEAVPEPTEAESQEFTDRLATEGGKVGEITITLLWNNRNDLDLVVICPNGDRLYYNSPTVCGGTLDVDRNAGKQLTDKPVENIHWPQEQAAAGIYRIAVKYYARKDGNAPPATPFQVRLLRNGQEQLFKGVIAPDELKSVTDFTVER
jgi:hypothetical protein